MRCPRSGTATRLAAKGPRGPTERKGGGRQGRRAAPFNEHVARDRLEKYYQRKRTFTKYRRLQRFEGRQQHKDKVPGETPQTFAERVFTQGADDLDAEYEQRLALSFGDGGEVGEGNGGGGAAQTRRKKRREDNGGGDVTQARRKKKRKRAISTEAADGAADEAAPHLAPKRAVPAAPAAGRRRGHADNRGAASAEGNRVAGSPRGRQREGSSEVATKRGAVSGIAGGGARTLKGAAEQAVPARYSKEFRKYQEAQDAKWAERQRNLEEAQDRNRRRRETARDRAIKGQLLTKRTARGQPRMQNVLELVTAKLAGGAGTRTFGGGRRGWSGSRS